MSSPLRRLRPFWWMVGIAWSSSLAGLGFALWSDEVLGPKQRLPPSLEAFANYSFWLCAVLLVATIGWLLFARPLRGVRNWWLVVLGMVLAFGAPGTIALTALVSQSLFSGTYITKLDVPEESKTYYLYTEGVFCGYDVYTRPYGSLYSHKLRNQARKCDDPKQEVSLARRGGQVVIVGEDGEPVRSHHRDFSGLYFGPR